MLPIISSTNTRDPLPIARPPWSGVGKKLESACRKALFEFDLIPPSGRIAIALSGGKDSLTLLFLLKAISGRGFPELDIHCIHVGGEFSCGSGVSTHFLRAICKELGVNFILRESTQKLETLECYRCSRERRALIFDAAKEIGAEAIAFGHHRDDSAQTLLMNLLHKAEFATILPKLDMLEYGVTIIRPLIFMSEAEIKTFSQQHGFARITCQCPVGQDSMRKKVDKILSELEALFPNVRANIAQAGMIYGSDKARRP